MGIGESAVTRIVPPFCSGVPGASQLILRHYGKTREGVPYSVFFEVAAPWGRGDLSAAASGYSISGFAIALRAKIVADEAEPEGFGGSKVHGISPSDIALVTSCQVAIL
jgi:hypothetical protein